MNLKTDRRPYPELCRTSYFIDEFWLCHVDHLKHMLSCPFALKFGYRYYCRHPDRHRFISYEKVNEEQRLLWL